MCAFEHCKYIVLQQMTGCDSGTSSNLNVTILFDALLLCALNSITFVPYNIYVLRIACTYGAPWINGKR